MNRPRLLLSQGIAVALVVAFACARASAPVEGSTAAAPAQSESRKQVIMHLTPRPDSVGGLPEKFEWTAVANADSYSIGLWNEVDRMIFRQNDLKTNSLLWPREFTLEMGTYLWSVTALSKGRPIGDSGLAAFVVNQ